ncbi:hypothetical protein GCM10022393_09170 [Aquimarina addita]|uniref:DUF4476 domain-containing protein n=2 Tax=Aquimarina addita TaxID=870485 RepID=A0ABP7XCG1_9FLAO
MNNQKPNFLNFKIFNMKRVIIAIVICLSSIQGYTQEVQGVKITKELICRGAAVSVVGNVKPFFDRNFAKSEILELTKSLVKEPIKDSPSKAYELFKVNKTKEEVVEILYNAFMKLDKETVSKFLINNDTDDY